MVPRHDIVAVSVEVGPDEALEVAVASGHRRLLVQRRGIDDVLGYVHLLDLVRERDRSVGLEQLVRTPLYVPEPKPIVELLREMQRERTHLAVVVDEFGAVAGLVTIEDLAEELLGELADETSPPLPDLVPLGDDRWLVGADLAVEDLARATGLDLPSGDWRTVGGMAMGVAGQVLGVGDTVTGDGWSARVASASGYRLGWLELTVTSSVVEAPHGNRREPIR